MKRGWFVLVLLLAACQDSGQEGRLLEVAPYRTACIGVGPMSCLQVREQGEDNYSLFYSRIEGFEFEPGYAYTLRVKVTPVENAPADASARRYSLLEVVERRALNREE